MLNIDKLLPEALALESRKKLKFINKIICKN
jgi:hypothetical protein